ncbi:MAG: ABC transporter ATP-binding protein [Desulfovibrio sp.]|nr:ABC transporter ATP-binding protein [Desulfovibrio sp.]
MKQTSPDTPPIISVRNLSKRYRITHTDLSPMARLLRFLRSKKEGGREKIFFALKNVSFDIHQGEKIGVIGHNGAGKSTLLKILSRITYPSEGEARIRGRVTSLLEVGTGFNPELTGRENIYLNAAMQGLTLQEVQERFDDIVQFSGVGKFLELPVKFYSSGMYARLGFSVAAHLDPDILLLDEVLSVGDVAFQEKCLKKMDSLTGGGRTVLFVSHSIASILQFCDRVIWLDQGAIRLDGSAVEVVRAYEETNRVGGDPMDLSCVTDRRGTGVARFLKSQLADADGRPCESVRTGQDIQVILEYEFQEEMPEKIHSVDIALAVENERQQRLISMHSDVLETDLTGMKKRGRFVCRIERLPLMPAVYQLLVSLHINHQLVDKVGRAGKVVVTEGDFFGTGRLPHKAIAPVCVDFDWRHESITS